MSKIVEQKVDDNNDTPKKPQLKGTLSTKVEQIQTDPHPLMRYIMPVSYTHLTLPTIYSV